MALDPMAGQRPTPEQLAKMARLMALVGTDEYKQGAMARMALIDALPEPLRLLVHEYGLMAVQAAIRKHGLNVRAIQFHFLSKEINL